MIDKTIRIWNDHKLLFLAVFLSELIVSWAKDFYRFSENEIATLELVTDSEFARYQVSIQGFPRQIPDRHPNRFPTLVVPGADFLGKGD